MHCFYIYSSVSVWRNKTDFLTVQKYRIVTNFVSINIFFFILSYCISSVTFDMNSKVMTFLLIFLYILYISLFTHKCFFLFILKPTFLCIHLHIGKQLSNSRKLDLRWKIIIFVKNLCILYCYSYLRHNKN